MGDQREYEETSEKLDHTLQAYGRLELKHGELKRELARVREERDEARERLVEIWHCGDSDKPLHEFLGMTWADYAAWVSPDALASPPEEQ